MKLDQYIEEYTERKRATKEAEHQERDARFDRIREEIKDLRYVGEHGGRAIYTFSSLRPEVIVVVSFTGQFNQARVFLSLVGRSYGVEGNRSVDIDLTAEDGIDFMLRAIAERVVEDVEDTHTHPAMNP
jgi:hypothetical protein